MHKYRLIHERDNGLPVTDVDWAVERLYMREDGVYYLRCEGGARSGYGRAVHAFSGDESWTGGRRWYQLSAAEACQWLAGRPWREIVPDPGLGVLPSVTLDLGQVPEAEARRLDELTG